jgi:hypothetical protein
MKNHFGTPQKIISKNKSTKLSARWKKSAALKDLERDLFELKRLRYPSNPYLTADQFEDKTAGGLTRSIIAYIQLKGGQAERVSTTGRPIDRTQTFVDVTGRSRTIGRIEWIPGTGTNGSADISATIKGRSVKIEVKIGSDRQSAAQKNYEKQVVSSFGLYVIARTFEDFVTWYTLTFDKP